MTEAWEQIKEVGIIPTIRTADPVKGLHAARAIKAGGIPVIEVSLAVPGALATLEAIAKTLGHEMVVGAGSVVRPDSLRAAVEHGATFIVTPGLSLETLDLGAQLGTLVLPGAMTPTEVQTAYLHGSTKVKLFPCDVVEGPRHIRALRNEYPDVEFIASGGVQLETCAEFIHSGAVAVGVGAAIADSKSIAKGDHKLFTIRSRRFVETVKHAQARWTLAQTSV